MTSPQWSVDWTSAITPTWFELFTRLGWVGKPNLHFLEIGCFEGRTTCWLLENVLTHHYSSIDVVDTFEGSPEHGSVAGLCERFLANINLVRSPIGRGQVRIYRGRSFEFLRNHNSPYPEPERYDFVYVDGSHRAWDVLTDAVLAWPLLKPGGVLLFDDYNWKWTDPATGETIEPRTGIDAFLHAFQGQYEGIMSGRQVAVMKPAT